MMWYWYFTGMVTVLFLQSILLNIGLAKGWVRFVGRKPEFTTVRLYDQDNSGSYKRAG
jgi:hypothetical protein